MNYCEFFWLFYKKYWQEKNPKIAIGNFTPSFPAAHCNRWSLPKRDLIYPSVTLFFQMMLPSFTWPQKLVFYWYQLFLFVKAALNLPNVVFFPTAMYYILPCFFSVWNQTEDWITNYNFATSTSVFLATDQQKVDERPTL